MGNSPVEVAGRAGVLGENCSIVKKLVERPTAIVLEVVDKDPEVLKEKESWGSWNIRRCALSFSYAGGDPRQG